MAPFTFIGYCDLSNYEWGVQVIEFVLWWEIVFAEIVSGDSAVLPQNERKKIVDAVALSASLCDLFLDITAL